MVFLLYTTQEVYTKYGTGSPRDLVSGVHCDKLHIEFACYIVIQTVPRHAVVDVPCGYLYAQDKAVPVTGCVCFIGKLPLVLSFYEHSAVGVCGGNRLFCRFSAVPGMLFVVPVFKGLLAQPFSFLVDLSAQLSGIDPCRLRDLFLLKLFLVGAGLDMGAVNENCARVDIR